MPRPRPALTSALILALASALLLSSCSGSAEPAANPSGAASPTAGATAAGVTTHTTLRQVVGRLPAARRTQLEVAVTASVDQWIDAAYLGGYPRTDFSHAFPSFTAGAARRARHDVDLMSNAGLGRDVTSVVASNRRLRLDVLAVKGRAVGVTAAFTIGLHLVGGAVHHDRVTGSLFLTHTRSRGAAPGGWRIFGYDVNRGSV